MDPSADRGLREVRRLGLRLSLDDTVMEGAADLLVRYASEASTPAGSTTVIAAASLYMSSVMWGRAISQARAGEAAGVSRGTLRKYYKTMVRALFPNAGECCAVRTER